MRVVVDKTKVYNKDKIGENQTAIPLPYANTLLINPTLDQSQPKKTYSLQLEFR